MAISASSFMFADALMFLIVGCVQIQLPIAPVANTNQHEFDTIVTATCANGIVLVATGLLLAASSRATTPSAVHLVGCGHIVLGAAHLALWESILEFNGDRLALVGTTAMHFVLGVLYFGKGSSVVVTESHRPQHANVLRVLAALQVLAAAGMTAYPQSVAAGFGWKPSEPVNVILCFTGFAHILPAALYAVHSQHATRSFMRGVVWAHGLQCVFYAAYYMASSNLPPALSLAHLVFHGATAMVGYVACSH